LVASALFFTIIIFDQSHSKHQNLILPQRTMKTILILRHAKSSWKHPELSDHDRPLNKRGRGEAPQVGQHLKEKGLLPDIILSSTALRARVTAQVAAEACAYEGEIRFIPDLYRADIEDFVGILQGLEEAFNTVLLVGHNPDLEMLLDFLTGEDESLPTATLAQVELPIQSWKELDPDKRGKLVHFWAPREES
jgi:phosphohistidine phosphatase